MGIKTAVVAYMGRHKVHTGIWWGNPEQSDQLKVPGICGRVIEKEVLKT